MRGVTYRPTALERRHPLIVARKRRQAENSLRNERYQASACTECGVLLDDVSVCNGYERCGDCE